MRFLKEKRGELSSICTACNEESRRVMYEPCQTKLGELNVVDAVVEAE